MFNHNKDKIKDFILIIIIIIILLPIFQFYYNPIKVKSLKGAVVLSENVKLSFKGWFSGDYQKKKEKYLNDNFGFRSDFVRINNQIKYSLFRQVNANGLIIGKNNYLYELNYIKAYYGMDFIGKDSIEHQLSKLKFIQDTLKKLNKNFILIFAAGKASFYPEYIPDEYKKQKSITNYEYMKMMADNKNINIIDFNNYFINNKNKSKYPLYPQYGIHWSNYGMCLVIDSLIKYIENKRGIDIPEFYWNDIEITEKYREPDYDLGEGLNLIFKLGTSKLAYPKYIINDQKSKVKPNVLVIADSFYWGIFNMLVSKKIFNNSPFWYYNHEIYPQSNDKTRYVDQLNLKKEIEKQDIIILMQTEATLSRLSFGFIDSVYKIYKRDKK